MSSLSTSNPGFPFIPNTVMRWTMSYADSVSRKQRLEYLRGITDIEAGMTLEKEDELLRMFDGLDSDDEEHHDSQELRRDRGTNASQLRDKGKGRGKEPTNEESSGIHGDCESWEMVNHLDHPSDRKHRPPQAFFPTLDQKSLGQSSKIQGLGLPGQNKHLQAASTTDELGKQLPPTPEELTALEQGNQGLLPASKEGLHNTPPLHSDTTANMSGLPVPIEEEQKPVVDLGYPAVEELFADLPDPVTPVFRDEDLTFPVKTIYNRHLFDSSLKDTGDGVWDRNDLTASPGPIEEKPQAQPESEPSPEPETVQETVPENAQAGEEEEAVSASPHSSANDNPPSDLLMSPPDADVDDDPTVQLQSMFEPILAHLRQEYMTTRLIHRHNVFMYKDSFGRVCSTRSSSLVTRANTYLPAPQDTDADNQDAESRDLRREQRRPYLAKATEAREHLRSLRKQWQRVKAVMKVSVESVRQVGESREKAMRNLSGEGGGVDQESFVKQGDGAPECRSVHDFEAGDERLRKNKREDVTSRVQGSSNNTDNQAKHDVDTESEQPDEADLSDGLENGLGHMLVFMRGCGAWKMAVPRDGDGERAVGVE